MMPGETAALPMAAMVVGALVVVMMPVVLAVAEVSTVVQATMHAACERPSASSMSVQY